MKKRDFEIKELPAGFELGTLRLQNLCLTLRPRVMIQTDNGLLTLTLAFDLLF